MLRDSSISGNALDQPHSHIFEKNTLLNGMSLQALVPFDKVRTCPDRQVVLNIVTGLWHVRKLPVTEVEAFVSLGNPVSSTFCN